MMVKKILVISTVLALAACGGDNTKEQMKQAINNVAALNQICVPYSLNVEQLAAQTTPLESLFGADEIQILTRDVNKKRVNKEAESQMEQLVRAGLYDEEKEKKVGEGADVQRVAVYRLTDRGREFIRKTPLGAGLCVATWRAEKINYYTEPTAVNGYTVSQVSYAAKIVPEKWAKSLLKADEHHKILLKDEINKNAMLVKTNDGWRDIRELKQSDR